MRCFFCREPKPDVTWRVDPFNLEIHDETIMRKFCDDCYDERRMDV